MVVMTTQKRSKHTETIGTTRTAATSPKRTTYHLKNLSGC